MRTILKDLKLLYDVSKMYATLHRSMMLAMKLVYTQVNTLGKGQYPIFPKTTIEFNYDGFLCTIIKKVYLDDGMIKQETWLANYSWGMPGNLVDIDDNRVCILVPKNPAVYLGDTTDGVMRVEIFTVIE